MFQVIALQALAACLTPLMYGATVPGTVIDAVTGSPLPNVSVSLYSADMRPSSARSSPTGAFELIDVEPGKYSIDARKAGYVPITRDPFFGPFVEVPADGVGKPVILRLNPNASVEGVVLSSDGKPVAGAIVEDSEHYLKAAADKDGRYRMESCPPGNLTLSVSVPLEIRRRLVTAGLSVPARTNYPGSETDQPASKIMVIAGRELKGIDFRLARVPVTSVSGTVIDAQTGEPFPVGEAALDAVDPNRWGESQERRPMDKGKFHFDVVRPGSYRLTAWRSSDRRMPPFSKTIMVGPAGVADFKVIWPPPTRLEGHVSYPSLGPGELRMTLAPKGSVFGAEATVGPDGRFVFEGITPGAWRLSHSMLIRAQRGGFPTAGRNATIGSITQHGRVLKGAIEVTPGFNAPVEVTIVPQPTVSGVLQDSTGTPMPRGWVLLIGEKSQALARAMAGGVFEIGLRPGEYRVSAFTERPDPKTECPKPLVIRVADRDVSGLRLVPCR